MAMCETYSPWAEMSVTYNGICTVACCEFKGKPTVWDTSKPLSLQALWNDERFINIRKSLAENKIDGSGCEGCARLVFNDDFGRLRVAPESMTAIQKGNWKSIEGAMKKGLEYLDSAPNKLALCFSPVCNLRCIMCSQEYFYLEEGTRELSADSILAEKEFLSKINTIELCGGEVFASKEAVRFLDEMSRDEELRHKDLFIVSNGLLLHKVMHILERFPRLRLHVSLDGVGKAYEKIRKQGKWERVSANIDMFIERRRELAQTWALTTSSVLLRTSVEHIEQFVDWVLQRDIPVAFQRLLSTRYSFGEDLLGNPEAREGVDWRGNLVRAAQKMRENGQGDAAKVLESFVFDLDNAPNEASVGSGVSDWRAYLESDEIKGKKVMIWGTGSNYRIYYADWLSRNASRVKFLGFVDNDAGRWGDTLDGYKVFSPEEALGMSPDVMLQAVTLIWRELISRQIIDLGFTDMEVV